VTGGVDVDGEADGEAEGEVDGDVGGELLGVVTPPVQAVPLSVKAPGTGFEPVNAPLKPNDVAPLVAMDPLYEALRTVTAVPDWVKEPFHSWLMLWPAPKENARFHWLIGSPRLVILTSAPKPPCHWLVTR
jgi:hypothetical protein